MCPSLSFLMRNWLHGPRGVTMRVERSFPQRTTLPGNNQSDQSSGSRPRGPQCPAGRRKPDPPHPVPRKNRLALPPPKYPHPGRTGLGPPAEETRCPRWRFPKQGPPRRPVGRLWRTGEWGQTVMIQWGGQSPQQPLKDQTAGVWRVFYIMKIGKSEYYL